MTVIVSGKPAVMTDHVSNPERLLRPGQLVTVGYDDSIGAVARADESLFGWAVSENPKGDDEPYDANSKIKVGRGGPFVVAAWLAPGFDVHKGDRIVAAQGGMVVPNRGVLQGYFKEIGDLYGLEIVGHAESYAPKSEAPQRILVRSAI